MPIASGLQEVAGMEMRLGAVVLLNDGTVGGRLSKVVLEPAKGTPTHIVVGNGQGLGIGRLVPRDRIVAGDEERVWLAIGHAELQALPEFDPDDFVPLEYGDWPAPYPVAAQPIVAWGRPYPTEDLPLPPPEPLAELPYLAPSARERPPGTIIIEPGMRVLGFDGQSIGLVEDLLTDARSGKATYLIVAGPWVDGHNRLVPASWIREVRGREICLVVGPRVIAELDPYPRREAHPQVARRSAP